MNLRKFTRFKNLAVGFYTIRIPLPMLIAEKLVGRVLHFPKAIVMVANNYELSKLRTIGYYYVVFIIGELRSDLSQIWDQKISSIFWSYKDTIIILCKLDKIVFRISGRASADLNTKNYNNLEKLSALGFSIFPQAISIRKVGPFLISCEEFLESSGVVSGSTPRVTFEGLFPLYQKTCSVYSAKARASYLLQSYRDIVPISVKELFEHVCERSIQLIENDKNQSEFLANGLIHGDLTPRNLAINSSGYINYFDMDRSEESFPEFDFFMTFIDNEIAFSGVRSYRRSLELASQIGSFSTIHDTLDWFYSRMPEYSMNKQHFELICNLFFIRIVTYIFSDAQFDCQIILNEVFNQYRKEA